MHVQNILSHSFANSVTHHTQDHSVSIFSCKQLIRYVPPHFMTCAFILFSFATMHFVGKGKMKNSFRIIQIQIWIKQCVMINGKMLERKVIFFFSVEFQLGSDKETHTQISFFSVVSHSMFNSVFNARFRQKIEFGVVAEDMVLSFFFWILRIMGMFYNGKCKISYTHTYTKKLLINQKKHQNGFYTNAKQTI